MSDVQLEEPRRLADMGGSPSAQMIRAGRRVHASPGAKRRLLRRLGWLSFVSAISSYAGDVAASVGGAKTFAWVTGVSVAAVAAGVSVFVVQTPAPLPPELPPAVEAQLPPVTLTEPAAEPLRPQQAERESEKATTPRGGTRSPASPQLSEEIRLIDSARTSLRQGEPRVAIRYLSQYSARFPNGRFSLEAAALRIESLAASGEQSRARALAQRFIANHPKSLLVERVRKYAAGPGTP